MSDQTARMRDREALHRSLVRESPSPIFLVDVETRRVRDANPALVSLLGYDLDELLELDLYNIDLGSRQEQDRLVAALARSHHDILGERTYRRRDGTPVSVEVSANLVIYEGRQVLCFFARDITERKAAEQERGRLHRQLSLSQKHEAVGRLAAGIAHDFNNHLMVMLLCAQLVRGRLPAGDESHNELEELAEAGKSAAQLIRQLLAFSGKQRLRPRPVVIDEVLLQLEKMIRRVTGEDVEIVTRLEAGEATVFADPTQLEQVVLNLVVNARDAMRSRGTLSISTSREEIGEDFVKDYMTLAPGPHVILKIQDTGEGMDEETLSHIFEPFYTTKAPGEGTGLGLATAYGIVKQSGGSIWASSTVGVGTTFRIYLPVTTQDAETVEMSEPTSTDELPTGTETVLLVEDEGMVRVLTARILRGLGYSVVEAEGAEEAMQALRGVDEGLAPDLLLTDVVMPKTSGISLVAEAHRIHPELKVILMSGYPPQRMGPDGALPDRYLFLEKPLTRAALARAVRQTLDS